MNNWYNIVLSSSNIRLSLTDDIKQDTIEVSSYIINDLWDDFYKSGESISKGLPIEFVNPYNNIKQVVYIVVSRANNEFKKVITQLLNDRIYVYPEHIINLGLTDVIISSKAIDILSSYIFHEIIHFIDPKNNQNNNFNLREKRKNLNLEIEKTTPNIPENYYTFQPEFDAFCSQICFDIEKNLKNNIIDLNVVLEWLKSPNIIPLLYFLNNYIKPMQSWIRKGNYTKILKQRIYNDLIQNKVLK
jgi:hypothetical protein